MRNALAYAGLALALAACERQAAEHSANTGTYCLDSAFRDRVEMIRPTRQEVAETIHLTGSVEAVPDKVVSFVSLVSGVVTSTSFSIGDYVRKGQVLAELRSTELSVLTSEMAGLNSKKAVAEARLESVKSMYAQGISSRKELLEAQSEVEVIRAELARVSEYLELYSASVSEGVFRIKAPASGIITQKNVTAGSQISPESGALFTISDLSRVWVLANVYATNVREIREGMDVDISTLSYRDEIFKGKISTIPSVMDQDEKVLKARIELDNREAKLKPGMHVDIRAHKPLGQTALSLPTRALVFDDNQNYVIVHRDDCDLHIQKVDVLAQNRETTYLAAGLDSTDTVISKNQLLIFEQLKNFRY